MFTCCISWVLYSGRIYSRNSGYIGRGDNPGAYWSILALLVIIDVAFVAGAIASKNRTDGEL
jgi:hypothetical protein